jgi:hypothetical protein
MAEDKELNIHYLKIYNETKNIGEIHRLENGVDVSYRFFKIENNKEIIIDPPEGDERHYYATHSVGSNEPISVQNEISVFKVGSEELFITIPKLQAIPIGQNQDLVLKKADHEIVTQVALIFNKLTHNEKKEVVSSIEQSNHPLMTLEGKKQSTASVDEVQQAIEAILARKPTSIEEGFYKTIDSKEEFGISRFVADRVYHMPQLLKNIELKRQRGTNTYILQSEQKDSSGSSIRLEHRILASCPEEATKISEIVVKRLQGVQNKIWMAAWQLANQLARFTYTCELTKLMKLCYPERDAHFNSAEKIEFYEHLRGLENTKIIFKRKRKKSSRSKNKSKEEYIEYEIRLLEIHGKIAAHDCYPNEITLTILNSAAFQEEKTAFLGTAIKNKTLELHSDDVSLALWVQTRKSQRMNENFIKLERDSLYRLAGLQKTSETNRSHANKLLLVKLRRLLDKGIIVSVPEKIEKIVVLQIR